MPIIIISLVASSEYVLISSAFASSEDIFLVVSSNFQFINNLKQ